MRDNFCTAEKKIASNRNVILLRIREKLHFMNKIRIGQFKRTH